MSIKNSSFAQLSVYDGPFSVNKSLANNLDGSVASFAGDSDGGFKPINTTVIVQDVTSDPLLARSRLQFYNRDAPVWCIENRGAELKMIKDNVTHVRLDEFGDAFFSGNVTVTGDLFADDISYDEETVNLMKVNTEIQHLNNATNKIAFDVDKMTLDASGAKIVLDNNIANKITMTGNVKMMNDLEVVGDIILDDISTDVITVKDRIQHDGNTSNFIAFETDKMTLDASGTSIVLDDAAMTDKVTVTGQTKFLNDIGAVPNVYLANDIIHLADTNTKIGFPANDQISCQTNGNSRLDINSNNVAIGGDTATATSSMYVHSTGNVSIKTDSQGAPGFPQNGLMIEQLSNIGWHNYANNGTYANMFRAPNSAALVLANGWRRSATAGQFESSVSDSWGRAALAIDGNYGMTFYQNDASVTPIGTNMTPTVQMVFKNASLGIGGITSPEASIHVDKAVSGGEGPYLFLDNSAASALNNKSGIRFANNAGATFANYGSSIDSVNVNAGNGAEEFTISTWNGTARGERMRLDTSGALLVGEATNRYNSKIYTSGGPISTRTGGVDGTYQDAFVAGYTSNYNERNVIRTAVSSASQQSGFQFLVSDGAGSANVTESFRINRGFCAVPNTLQTSVLTLGQSYHGQKNFIFDAASSVVINVVTEFPLVSLVLGNSWAIFGKCCLLGAGGSVEAREFNIGRTATGIWQAANYYPTSASTTLLQSVVGTNSTGNITINMASNTYLNVVITAMMR